jgi:hypothetical protein
MRISTHSGVAGTLQKGRLWQFSAAKSPRNVKFIVLGNAMDFSRAF